MFRYFALMLILLSVEGVFAQSRQVKLDAGVSKELALHRKKSISNIQYDLFFKIPDQRSIAIQATATIRFTVKDLSQPVLVDCQLPRNQIKNLLVNGRVAEIDLLKEHLVINTGKLNAGANSITVEYTCTDAALNRNDDYLYTLLVPDHARSVFPSFDQPDLKARFLLKLQTPQSWQALSSAEIENSTKEDNSTIYRFGNSDIMSTYLFAFTAGKYHVVSRQLADRNMRFFYYETDTAKIRLSTDSVFEQHHNAINFLENYTAIKFPFKKMDYAAIPDFQFGGMEHPGATFYKASSLFLDQGATQNMLLDRSVLISHETAHQWFGNLVTMSWFDDVWLKEVFANFMADKIVKNRLGTDVFNHQFLLGHVPTAYGVDRTGGRHAVRQSLDNLNNASSLYGSIIYHKAPVVMRQLELLMGNEQFQRGLQEYLTTYSYNNASWENLIEILDKYTGDDLKQWSRVWVSEAGRPIFSCDIKYDKNKINSFKVMQRPEHGKNLLWPQVFHIALVYPDTTKTIKVLMNKHNMPLPELVGLERPSFILFNYDGIGYGIFPADSIKGNIVDMLPVPLHRASYYINLYENMLAARQVRPKPLLQVYEQALKEENNELNLGVLARYMSTIYWQFLKEEDRTDISVTFEKTIWDALVATNEPNNKKVLFRLYQQVSETPEAWHRLYTIWRDSSAPKGLKLTEDDYTALAATLALKTDSVTNILEVQRLRIRNADRKNRLAFLTPALSPDTLVRDSFFLALGDKKNREKEPWVADALSYLHHPLRQQHSIKYLQSSLEMLEEIKRTGDIFFPENWLRGIFSTYQRPDVGKMVRQFLKERPDYNEGLRLKILQAADNLFRAEQLVR